MLLSSLDEKTPIQVKSEIPTMNQIDEKLLTKWKMQGLLNERGQPDENTKKLLEENLV